MRPLYKIWEEICDQRKIKSYNLTEEEKDKLYSRILDAMKSKKTYIDLYNLQQPFEIKKWLKSEHHLKCDVERIQVINGPAKSYADTHYCYVSWN